MAYGTTVQNLIYRAKRKENSEGEFGPHGICGEIRIVEILSINRNKDTEVVEIIVLTKIVLK